MPFNMPTPIMRGLPIHFSHHDIKAAKNQHHVCDGVAQTQILQNGQVDETRRPHAISIRVRSPVADQIKSELALWTFDPSVGFAHPRFEGADFYFRIYDRTRLDLFV